MTVIRGVYKPSPTLMNADQQRELRSDPYGALIVSRGASDGTIAPSSTPADPSFTVIEPNGSSVAALSGGQTAAAASSLVLKASTGNLYGLEVCTGATGGYLMLFDAVSAPADGAVTPKRVYTVAANASYARQLQYPVRCATGITLVFSSTGPFTKTASATTFLAGDYV